MSKSSPRRRLTRQGIAGLALGAAFLAQPARAQDAEPLSHEQSDSLDRAIVLWTSGLAGGEHGGKYAVTPEGDHYALKIPVEGPLGKTGAKLQGDPLVATVRPMDGDRWVFENASGPASVTLVPAPGKTMTPLSLVQTAATNVNRTVIDPSLATTSTMDGTSTDVAATISVTTPVSFHADKVVGHGEWRPAGDGRVDRVGTTTVSNVTYAAAGDAPFKATIRTLTADSKIAGFAPARVAELADLVAQFLGTVTPEQTPATPSPVKPPVDPAAPQPTADTTPVPDAAPDAAPGPANKMTAEQRVLLHRLLDTLRQVATGFDQTMTAEGMAVEAQGQAVTVGKFAVTQSMSAPGGKSDTSMRFAVDEVDSPAIPPPLRQYVPHHFVMAPHVSGIVVDDMFAAIGRAIDSDNPKSDDFSADAMASMAKGPLTVGMDELSFDFGSSALAATGLLKIVSPQDMAGTADIKVTGFDALMKRASTDPMLKQAAPALIFLKGIGQQDGDTVVWKVVYADKKVSVNGTDMSQMLPQ